MEFASLLKESFLSAEPDFTELGCKFGGNGSTKTRCGCKLSFIAEFFVLCDPVAIVNLIFSRLIQNSYVSMMWAEQG